GDAGNRERVAAEFPVQDGAPPAFVADLVDLRQAVGFAAGGKCLAVRPENDLGNAAAVAVDLEAGEQGIAGGGVDDPDEALLVAGREPSAVGTEGNAGDDPLVPLPQARLLARGDGPQPHGAVLAAAGEGLAVGAEGDAGDGVGMAGKTVQFLAAVGIPDLD